MLSRSQKHFFVLVRPFDKKQRDRVF